MSEAENIPYVGHGDKGYITQEVAEQHVKTADYWRDSYFELKKCLEDLNNLFAKNLKWQEIEFNRFIEDKKTDKRIIMLLSVVCFVQGLFLIGGKFL